MYPTLLERPAQEASLGGDLAPIRVVSRAGPPAAGCINAGPGNTMMSGLHLLTAGAVGQVTITLANTEAKPVNRAGSPRIIALFLAEGRLGLVHSEQGLHS